MAELHAVTQNRHGNKAWRRHDNYRFAAGDALCPLAAQELPRAMMGAPLAFVLQDEAYIPVMVQGLQPGANLLVSDQGFWRGRYLPRNYRTYPFFLAPNEKKELVLCIDEESGVLCDAGATDCNAFFTDAGETSETTQALLKELQAQHEGLQGARQLAAHLQNSGLIKPWELILPVDEDNLEVNGLFCVDEEKLNSLQADDFVQLRDNRALLLAYCQLLSMSHARGLAGLVGQLDEANGEQELSFGENDGGSISFDNL